MGTAISRNNTNFNCLSGSADISASEYTCLHENGYAVVSRCEKYLSSLLAMCMVHYCTFGPATVMVSVSCQGLTDLEIGP